MVLPEEIQSEITSAQKALEDGNDGKARVCARRAVGKAFQFSNPSKEIQRSINANEVLKLIAVNEKFSEKANKAARRLSASVIEAEISLKPVEDALLIIKELLSADQ